MAATPTWTARSIFPTTEESTSTSLSERVVGSTVTSTTTGKSTSPTTGLSISTSGSKVLRYRPAAAFHQHRQELELIRRQVHDPAGDGDLAPRQVDLEQAELEDRIAGERVGGGAVPQRDADARQQLGDAEGLGQVIICAGVERD